MTLAGIDQAQEKAEEETSSLQLLNKSVQRKENQTMPPHGQDKRQGCKTGNFHCLQGKTILIMRLVKCKNGGAV